MAKESAKEIKKRKAAEKAALRRSPSRECDDEDRDDLPCDANSIIGMFGCAFEDEDFAAWDGSLW